MIGMEDFKKMIESLDESQLRVLSIAFVMIEIGRIARRYNAAIKDMENDSMRQQRPPGRGSLFHDCIPEACPLCDHENCPDRH